MGFSASGRTAYVNCRLIDPASGLDEESGRNGGVLVEGETIKDFGRDLFGKVIPEDIEIVDCRGLCLAPGLVDMRVQLREPGLEHKETFKSGGRAAVAGGVTTMVCLPNTEPVIDTVATVEFVARRARQIGLAKVYPYAAATKGLNGTDLAEMGMLAEAGAVAFTDGEKAIVDTLVMRRALAYARSFNLMIVQHPEDPYLARHGHMNEGEMATRLGIGGIPAAAEAIMVARDVRLAELTGGRLHISHVSTGESCEIIARAKERGVPVTCDTAPPYFALNEFAVGDYRTFAKLSPPLRDEADRIAIVEALRTGVIDAIASDHVPQDQDTKRQPFAMAENGGIGLETLLPVSLELFHNGHLSLPEILSKLSRVPAELLGLDAGRLRREGPADLVIFDPDRAWVVDADKFRSKSKNSPFDGRPIQGQVWRTVIDGRLVYDHDTPDD